MYNIDLTDVRINGKKTVIFCASMDSSGRVDPVCDSGSWRKSKNPYTLRGCGLQYQGRNAGWKQDQAARKRDRFQKESVHTRRPVCESTDPGSEILKPGGKEKITGIQHDVLKKTAVSPTYGLTKMPHGLPDCAVIFVSLYYSCRMCIRQFSLKV